MKAFFSLIFLIANASIVSSQIFTDHSKFFDGNKLFLEVSSGFPAARSSYSDTTITYILLEVHVRSNIIKQQIYELSAEKSDGLNIDLIRFHIEDTLYVFDYYALSNQKEKIAKIGSAEIRTNNILKNVSDIQLGYSAKKSSNRESQFYKNGVEFIPNPSTFYDSINKNMYYYYELYNYNNSDKDLDSIFVDISVVNSMKQIVMNSKKIKAKMDLIIDIGGFDIKTLEQGSYTLRVNCKDRLGKFLYETNKRFYVGTDKHIISNTTKQSLYNEISLMSMDETILLFSQIKYIASDQEIRIFTTLRSLSDKQKFIEEFFNKRSEGDHDGFLIYSEYMRKVEYANDNYSTVFVKGWKSDRGRIFILYGSPTDIERFNSSGDTKPYQIWTYNSMEGGVTFIFGDISENGNYELLHSTKRSEISNTSWMNLLQVNQR